VIVVAGLKPDRISASFRRNQIAGLWHRQNRRGATIESWIKMA